MNQLMSQFPLSHGSCYIHLAIRTGLFSVLQICPFLFMAFACAVCSAQNTVMSPSFLNPLPLCLATSSFSRSLSVPHLREAIPDSQLKLYSFKHAAQSIVKPMTLEKSYQVFSYVRLKPPLLGWVPILSQVIVKFPGLFSFDTYQIADKYLFHE